MAGDLNVQRYVGNNPINYIDSSGLSAVSTAAQNRRAAAIGSAAGSGIASGLACLFGRVAGAVTIADQENTSVTLTKCGAVAVTAATTDIIFGGVIGKTLGFGKKVVGRVCCFTAGTSVLTSNGQRPIETIKVGDQVLSYNEDTGETAYKEVIDTIPSHPRIIWEVEIMNIKGVKEVFETTSEHPWWIEGTGWVETYKLKEGSRGRDAYGDEIIIASILQTSRIDQTYNITVADWENYFVGDSKVLVHNCLSFNGALKLVKSSRKISNNRKLADILGWGTAKPGSNQAVNQALINSMQAKGITLGDLMVIKSGLQSRLSTQPAAIFSSRLNHIDEIINNWVVK